MADIFEVTDCAGDTLKVISVLNDVVVVGMKTSRQSDFEVAVELSGADVSRLRTALERYDPQVIEEDTDDEWVEDLIEASSNRRALEDYNDWLNSVQPRILDQLDAFDTGEAVETEKHTYANGEFTEGDEVSFLGLQGKVIDFDVATWWQVPVVFDRAPTYIQVVNSRNLIRRNVTMRVERVA